MSASFLSCSARAVPMAPSENHFNAERRLKKFMGVMALMGIGVSFWALPAGRAVGPEAIMAGALDPMPIKPIMPQFLIHFGAMAQPISKRALEFCTQRRIAACAS